MKTTLEVLEQALIDAKARLSNLSRALPANVNSDFYLPYKEKIADIETAIEREKRGWVGLTANEINDFVSGSAAAVHSTGLIIENHLKWLIKTIEAKLKEKNA